MSFNSKWFYFYHLRPNNGVIAYRIERPISVHYAQVPGVIDDIFANLATYQPSGSDLGDITWRHKSYLVLVLEDASEKITGVDFKRHGDNGNNTFLDQQLIQSVNHRADVSGFYCINYMKNKNGVELGEDEAEVYRIKVKHHRKGAEANSPRGHEDAGTNMGPPRT